MDLKDIKPFHLFQHKGSPYVINIERMKASPLDEITAQALHRTVTERETLLTSDMERNLEKLELISDLEDKGKKKSKMAPIPIVNMALFLTQSCNLKCIYCYEDDEEYRSTDCLEEKTALQAVDWLIEQSGKKAKLNILFFGGEPFLNYPMMKVVAQYAEQRVKELDKRVAFHLTTNATLLNDETINFLKKYNANVTVSIDGPKEIHDMQRPFPSGKGSYDVILPKIKKLLKVLPETWGHAVIADGTDPAVVKKAIKSIGFSKVTIGIMSQSLFSEESCKTQPSKDLSKILKNLELEADEWLYHTKNRDPEAIKELIYTGTLYEGVIYFLHNIKKQYPCKAGLEFVGVSCAGDVYPCQRFVGLDPYKLGHVSNTALKRHVYHKTPATSIKKCAGCFARHYCAGGCKYLNAVYGGSILKPFKDICSLKRRQLELSAYIYCMLDDTDHTFLSDYKIFPPKPCPLDF